MQDGINKDAMHTFAGLSLARFDNSIERIMAMMLGACGGDLPCALQKVTRMSKSSGVTIDYDDESLFEMFGRIIANWKSDGFLVEDETNGFRAYFNKSKLAKRIDPTLLSYYGSPSYGAGLDQKAYNHLVSVSRDDPFAWSAAALMWAMPKQLREIEHFNKIVDGDKDSMKAIIALLDYNGVDDETLDVSCNNLDAALTAIDRMAEGS